MAFPHHVDNVVEMRYTYAMARPPRNEVAVANFARHVARLAKRQPTTAKDIELWAYANLGLRVSQESTRKALNGEIDPTQCAVELLLALLGYFGVEPSALGSAAEKRLRPVLAFAADPNGGGGQEVRSTIWKAKVVPIPARPGSKAA